MNAAGTEAGNSETGFPGLSVFSADGTKMAFSSSATDLLPTSPGFGSNIYLRDLTAGSTTLVSVDAAGTGGGDGDSFEVAISPDGTKVAFAGEAGNLGSVDSPRPCCSDDDRDIYLRDLTAGTTTLLSTNASGTDSGDRQSWHPVFSPAGDRVAFLSRAADLGPTDSNARADIYVRDLTTGVTSLVTANAAGTDAANRGVEEGFKFSPDGTRIAFHSFATDLVVPDSNGMGDVFLRDLTTGTTSLVSLDATGSDSAAGGSGGRGSARAGRRSPSRAQQATSGPPTPPALWATSGMSTSATSWQARRRSSRSTQPAPTAATGAPRRRCSAPTDTTSRSKATRPTSGRHMAPRTPSPTSSFVTCRAARPA